MALHVVQPLPDLLDGAACRATSSEASVRAVAGGLLLNSVECKECRACMCGVTQRYYAKRLVPTLVYRDGCGRPENAAVLSWPVCETRAHLNEQLTDTRRIRI